MISLSIFPNEHGESYIGRLMHLNGINNRESIISLIMEEFSLHEDLQGIDSIILYLYSTAIYEFDTHSEYPEIMELINNRRACEVILSSIIKNRRKYKKLPYACDFYSRPASYLCIKCVEESVLKYGMSYWREDHQLIGETHCITHGCRLRYTTKPNAFLSSPASLLTDTVEIDYPDIEAFLAHPRINRFLDISCYIGNLRHEVDIAQLKKLIRTRAMMENYEDDRCTYSDTYFSDGVFWAFPEDWVRDEIPGFEDKDHSSRFDPIDGILFVSKKSPSIVQLALVLASNPKRFHDAFDVIDKATLSKTGARREGPWKFLSRESIPSARRAQ